MELKDIEQFPINADEARFLLELAFEIDSKPSMDGLPDKYKESPRDLSKLRRILEAMHSYAVYSVYFKGVGKAYSEFYLKKDMAIVTFDTTHLYGCPNTEVFNIPLDHLFGSPEGGRKGERVGVGPWPLRQ